MAEETKENTVEELLAWFEKDILPKLAAEGKLPVPDAAPSDLVVKAVEYESTERGVDHFASLPYFLKLVLQDKTNPARCKQFSLIAKFINQKLAVRQAMEIDTQFYNEMVFYNEVIPTYENFLRDRANVPADFLASICPVCRYAHIDLDAPNYALVIMDDLRQDGYSCAKSKAELDLDHCLHAMEKLAKFHAVSLALNIENPQAIEKLKTRFKECRYQDERYKEEMNDKFFSLNGMRGVNYLMSKGDSEVPQSYLDLIAGKLNSGIYRQMREFVEPREPLSVICHGDFCRNNILYKLVNGKPIDCKLFDYQTWRYSSPAVDLTFFIYMNTTLQLRQAHFDEIFDCYYNNLIQTTALITSKPVEELKNTYLRDALLKDFRDLSLYGYAIAAFFLPMMMFPKENAGDFESEWETKTWDEMVQENLVQGGETATISISEIIIDMYRRKCYL